VGGETAKSFNAIAPANRVRSFPGARVRRLVGEVKNLTPAPKCTLVLAAGGNDYFRRDGVRGSVNTLLDDFDEILKEAKGKTGRVVVVGIVPRKYYKYGMYNGAKAINKKLDKKCRDLGFRFIDPWDTFFGKDEFYQRDGVHFSDAGAKAMAKMMNQRLYGAPKTRASRRRRQPTASTQESARPVPTLPPLSVGVRTPPRAESPMLVDLVDSTIPAVSSPVVEAVAIAAPVGNGLTDTVDPVIPGVSPPVTRKRTRHQSSPGSISGSSESQRPAKKGREGGEETPSPNRDSEGGDNSPSSVRGSEGGDNSPSPSGNENASVSPLGDSGCSLPMPDPSETK